MSALILINLIIYMFLIIFSIIQLSNYNFSFNNSHFWNLDYISLSFARVIPVIVFVAVSAILYKLKHYSSVIISVVTVCLALIVYWGNISVLWSILLINSASLTLGLELFYRLNLLARIKSAPGIYYSIAWYLGFSVITYILWIILHFEINNIYIYNLIFVGINLLWINKLSTLRNIYNAIFGRMEYRHVYILSIFLFLLPYGFYRYYLCDDLCRHLFVAKEVSIFGIKTFSPNFIWSLDSQIFGQIGFVANYIMGGENALRIQMLLYSIISLITISSLCRLYFDSKAALLSIIILTSTPLFFLINSVVFLESINLVSAVIVLAVGVCLVDGATNRDLLLLFSLSSFAYLMKQQNFFVLMPVVLFAILFLAKFNGFKVNSLKYLALGMLLCIAILLPQLIQNYYFTSNPLFPFFNNIFKSKYFFQKYFEGIPFPRPGLSSVLTELTFWGQKYTEHKGFLIGVAWFIFLPITVLAGLFKIENKKLFYYIFACFLSTSALWYLVISPNLRYSVMWYGPASILTGVAISNIINKLNNRILKNAFIASLMVIIIFNFVLYANIGNVPMHYPIPFLATPNQSNLTNNFINLFKVAGDRLGKNAKGLLIGSWGLYFGETRIEYFNRLEFYVTAMELAELSTPEDIYNYLFNVKHFEYIILPENDSNNHVHKGNTKIKLIYTKYFKENTIVIDRADGYKLIIPKKTKWGR